MLTQRSGVNRTLALTRVELVRAELGAARLASVEDLTSCAGKKACLMKAARERGWTALITVEAAAVLDEAILNVTLLSIDDDGRAFSNATIKTSDARLAQELPSALRPMRVALDGLFGVVPVQPEPVAKPEPVVKPEPIVKADPVVKPEPVEPEPRVTTVATRPAARWIPFAASLGVTAVGGLCFGISVGQADRLRSAPDLKLDEIDGLVRSGKTFQTFGVAALIGGGIATVGSLALALLWPESPVTASLSLSPTGATFGAGCGHEARAPRVAAPGRLRELRSTRRRRTVPPDEL